MHARSVLIGRLKDDLIGPSLGKEEIVEDRPSDRYLTGILFPQDVKMVEEEDESIPEIRSGKVDESDTVTAGKLPISRTVRPATAGISFAIKGSGSSVPRIIVHISAGTYHREKIEDQVRSERAQFYEGLVEQSEGGELTSTKKNFKLGKNVGWRRFEKQCKREIVLNEGFQHIDLREKDTNGQGEIPGLGLFVRSFTIDSRITATVQAVNLNLGNRDSTRNELEEMTFFQFEINVTTVDRSEFVARPVYNLATDEDSKTASLIYRNDVEYATGHTCSAYWTHNKAGKVDNVSATWMPHAPVKSVDPEGDGVFRRKYADIGLKLPTAKLLSKADTSDLKNLLQPLADAYDQWLTTEASKISSLQTEELKQQAIYHLDRCRKALARMRHGILLVTTDNLVRRAFQTANAAMALQASWSQHRKNEDNDDSNGAELTWRPFQLGFALMSIRSFHEPSHEDRNTFDLIWFPTGGGKTEAYLLVASFLLFYRRLSNIEKECSYGTAVLMRYTLRTLTVQQFQRASSLICACELIRRGPQNEDGMLGNASFSIGLWVGKKSTPNDSKTAVEVLHAGDESTPKQIEICPSCHTDLVWEATADRSRVLCRCENNQCVLSKLPELPILTVDDQIYLNPPSLLIGTIDKFAQLVRNTEIGAIFGRNTPSEPPDLIIQDELHLISGPLGTLAGIYETVIDQLCTMAGIVPKVIGSTATIRRAGQQINAIFQREAFQFPPPAIDAENSGFARIEDKFPSRLYVGVTTAGRTDKYMLQAVCASLLQATLDPRISDNKRDPYGTLVAYFNSLRVLGGALVAMQDDVPKTIAGISRMRGENSRQLSEPEEMTSRKVSSEIPKVLRQLEIPYGEPGSIDTLLASNMLSVGVDIPRLGLMVVNGQPKTMSEYIQSTSRVGRQKVPGLVVTIYNNSKPRDRAHFETFKTWHTSLYRSVEATSVTPFAARARDKALHAALVGLARHMLPNFKTPTLSEHKRQELESNILPIILSRIGAVDKTEADAAKEQLLKLLDEWEERGKLKHYWKDREFRQSLLISAEKAAARKVAGYMETMAWDTPNSMRNVEPGVDFQLWESAELNRGR